MKQNLSLKNATQLQLKQMREIPSWSFATYRVREEWSLCDKGFCHRIRKDWGRKRRCVRSTSGQIVDHRWNRALTKPPPLGGLLFHYVQGDNRHKNPTGEQQYTYYLTSVSSEMLSTTAAFPASATVIMKYLIMHVFSNQQCFSLEQNIVFLYSYQSAIYSWLLSLKCILNRECEIVHQLSGTNLP